MKNRRKEYIHAIFEHNHISFISGVVFTFLRSLMYITNSYLFGVILDMIINPGEQSIWTVIIPCEAAVLLSCISNLLVYYFKSRFIHKGIGQLKDTIYSKLTKKSFRAFSKENTARYLSLFSNDIKSIEDNFLNNIFLLLYYVTAFIFAFIAVFYVNYRLALFLIIVGVISLLVSSKMSNRLAVLEKNVSDENETFMAKVKDLISGFSIIKSYKVENEGKRLFSSENKVVENKKRSRRFCEGALASAGDFFGFLMQDGVILYGWYLIWNGKCSVGDAMAVVSLSNYIFQPVSYVPQLMGAFRAAGKLFDKIIDVVSENSDEQNGVEIHRADNIVLNDVSFSYDDTNEVLHHISCTFEKGKKYAIIGDSGSGKSTMLNLLMGAFDNYHGSLKVDETEMKDINSDSLFDEVSLIDQNVFLFDASIKDNITMFKDVEEEKLMDAIQKAGLS